MNLIDVPKVKLVQIDTKKVNVKKLEARGCDYCPANHVKGVTKIFNKVKDRPILIFTSYPGPKENEEGKTLIGSTGEFLFDELAKVGINRKDCDVQNAIRCFPADRRDGSLYKREPKKEEIHCCSVYNDEVKAKTKAKIYVLLGAVTHKAILGKDYKKSKRVFWSDTLKAKVYCLAHPNYFLGGHAPQLALDEFRSNLRAIAQDIKGGTKNISQYAYLEKKNYRAIRTPAELKEVWRTLLKKAKNGNRITVDIEHDVEDDNDPNSRKLLLCCGFTHTPGQSDVVIIDHPKALKREGKWKPLPRIVRRRMKHILGKILADKRLKKAFHQGSSDVPILEAQGMTVKAYDYDTIYAEFFAHPDRRTYGLTAVALQKYPQFGDYKNIILPECIPPGTKIEKLKGFPKNGDLDQIYKYVGYHNLMHFKYLPLKKLVLRNGADCDITKRLELSTKDKVPLPLLRIYRDAAFVLAEMEPNGPEFDYKHHKKLENLYPPKLAKVLDRIRAIAENPNFNPGSPKQILTLLYQKLKIKPPECAFDKKKKRKRDPETGEFIPLNPGAGKIVLEVLSRKHEIAKLIQEYRRLKKIISTYLNAFVNNANLNFGRLKTKWWLTGTRTGRLSSGGDKQMKEAKNKNINLQNIHGDPNIQNLATADKDWRKLYIALRKAVGKYWANSLEEIKETIHKLQRTKNKDKAKLINEKLYGKIGALKKKLYISGKWKKLARNIVLALGSICVLLGFDQGQIEVRVMAQASGDENLIRDCMSGDIHSKVGHAMTGWPIEKIKKDKKTRTLTKNIHFGILFGLGADGLMDFIKAKDPDSTIDQEEAQRLYNNYFKAYPKVRAFITAMREFVEEHGYVENMFGFRRPLKDKAQIEGYDTEDEDEDQNSDAFWGNQAINTPIQGAAHMLMLMALAVLHRKKEEYKLLGVPTIEVHDYMGSKVPLKNLIKAFHLFKHLLEKEPLNVVKKSFPHIKWKIPLVVEGKAGFRLGDSVELEEDGKVKDIHEILVDMFFESFIKEEKLNADLRLAA